MPGHPPVCAHLRGGREDRLRTRIIALARENGRYGDSADHRAVTPGRGAHKSQTREADLATGRLESAAETAQSGPTLVGRWLRIRQRPEYPNHVWSYDFVMERTQDGRPLKLLTVVDEYNRECLAIAVRRHRISREVQEVLSELFSIRGCPAHIRSDNGPEFMARALRAWYGVLTIAPLFIESGSPWGNGYVESFNGKLRDEWLNGDCFIHCTKHRCSSNAGDATTTSTAHIVHLAIGHQPQKHARSHRSFCRRDRTGLVA